MEYEEIRDRLQTLKYKLACLANSQSQSESRLHDSLERTDKTRQEAKSVNEEFGRIERDLEEAEEGMKNLYKQLLKVDIIDERECLEEQDQKVQNQKKVFALTTKWNEIRNPIQTCSK